MIVGKYEWIEGRLAFVPVSISAHREKLSQELNSPRRGRPRVAPGIVPVYGSHAIYGGDKPRRYAIEEYCFRGLKTPRDLHFSQSLIFVGRQEVSKRHG